MKVSIEIISVIVIGMICLYQYCSPPPLNEHFDNITNADIDSIRNLSSIATKLMQPNGTLTNPGNVNITGGVIGLSNGWTIDSTDTHLAFKKDGVIVGKLHDGFSSWFQNGVCAGPWTEAARNKTGNLYTNDMVAARGRITNDITADQITVRKITSDNIKLTMVNSTDGYYQFSDNFYLQFGLAPSHDDNAVTTITFPKPFTKVLACGVGSNSAMNSPMVIMSTSNTGMTLDASHGLHWKAPVMWHAFGTI